MLPYFSAFSLQISIVNIVNIHKSNQRMVSLIFFKAMLHKNQRICYSQNAEKAEDTPSFMNLGVEAAQKFKIKGWGLL